MNADCNDAVWKSVCVCVVAVCRDECRKWCYDIVFVERRGKRGNEVFMRKVGLFLIGWGIAPAKNRERLANRKEC